MAFPDSFDKLNKFYWWIFLLILATIFLIFRIYSILAGFSNPIDFIIFLIWIALLLVPFFEEINVFGIKLKREIEDLKTDLTSQIISLRSDVHNSINLKSEIKPNFYLNPPNDEQLTKIEENLKKKLEETLKDKGIGQVEKFPEFDVDEGVKFLFSVRYQIEREIRRIWDDIFLGKKMNRNRFSILMMINDLTEAGIIDHSSAGIIREVTRVCNPTIHGEDVSNKQVDFVRKIAPELITILKSIE